MKGEMLWFNEEKGFGFILTEDGERIRVNQGGFVEGQAPVGRCARLPVELTVVEDEAERVAVNVSMSVEKNHGRARLRHSGSRSIRH